MVSGRLEWMRSALTRPGFKIIRPGFKPEPPGRNKPQILKKNSGFRGRFVSIAGVPNSQHVLNNSASLSLKRGPILNRVQHYPLRIRTLRKEGPIALYL